MYNSEENEIRFPPIKTPIIHLVLSISTEQVPTDLLWIQTGEILNLNNLLWSYSQR